MFRSPRLPAYAPVTATGRGYRMRHAERLTAVVLLMACLGGCGHAAQPLPPITTATAPMAPPPEPPTSVADEGLAIAVAREEVDRSAREQTLRVQKQLREQERVQKQLREAAERGDGSERCISGQKMRSVDNGWVQA